jgi:hypothetical protein
MRGFDRASISFRQEDGLPVSPAMTFFNSSLLA